MVDECNNVSDIYYITISTCLKVIKETNTTEFIFSTNKLLSSLTIFESNPIGFQDNYPDNDKIRFFFSAMTLLQKHI